MSCVRVCVFCLLFVVYLCVLRFKLSSDLIVSGTHEKFVVKVTWYKCRLPSHAK